MTIEKIVVCDWGKVHIHPYAIVSSRAKHPVRMIEGGQYLTENMDVKVEPQGEMGVWGLNQKDYATFKKNLTEKEIKI